MGTVFWYLSLADDEHCDYDQYDSFVIEATSENEARQIATEAGGDNAHVWQDHKRTTCEPLVLAGANRVVIGSFNAG